MELVSSGTTFSFLFLDPLQNDSLEFVAGKVFDVSTGSAVLLDTVPMVLTEFGVYTGVYDGELGKTYLVVAASFIDGAYLVADDRAACTSEFQIIENSVVTCAFDYTDFGQSPSLFVQASVYEVILGSPVFVTNVEMAYVTLGAYLGLFTGETGKLYSISKMVFTDGTFTVPDPDRAPGADTFQAFAIPPTVINSFGTATLIGQTLNAVLIGE